MILHQIRSSSHPVILITILIIIFAQPSNATKCEDLGFTHFIRCIDCSTLAQFIGDSELVSECLQCCAHTEDASKDQELYTQAAIEVCPHSVRSVVVTHTHFFSRFSPPLLKLHHTN